MAPSLIDRSNNNGTDSYAVARKAGVCFAYFKATEGTGFKDSTYVARRSAARAAGLKVGAYHFAGHDNPEAEADFFLAFIGKQKTGQLRPCLDLESGQTAGWAATFARRIHDKLGYWPVLYGSTSFIAGLRAQSATLRKCPWWRAEFGPNDGARHPLDGGNQGAAAHQYTSVATVPGIEGRTDASVVFSSAALRIPSRFHYTIRTGGGRLIAAFGRSRHLRSVRFAKLTKKFRRLVIRREAR